ncbi:MAG TPA: hypothetical protein VME19_05645 [Streptosporangiaceae bacterium]|nr:hypothetical protein [Streptosporangiaceae bacterium]
MSTVTGWGEGYLRPVVAHRDTPVNAAGEEPALLDLEDLLDRDLVVQEVTV